MIIPDDNPSSGRYMTLKDVAQMLFSYVPGDVLTEALDRLDAGEPLVLDGKGGFRIAFVPEGTGLFLCYLNENYTPEEDA